MRHLWLVRHAKSSWGDPAQRDFDRPLNARGERDAPRMQAWLANQANPAQWLWSSPAKRAQQTAQFVKDGFGIDSNHCIEESALYLASVPAIIDTLRSTPGEIESVALVAHNPGLTEAVNALAGEYLIDNLPTFGVALFEFEGDWTTLGYSKHRCDELMSPKRLPD